MKKLILASLLLSAALPAAGSAYAAPLYFPHVATIDGWQTEIAIINMSDQTVTGTLKGFRDDGTLVETKNDVTLSAHGRRQIIVADEFTNNTAIGYIICKKVDRCLQFFGIKILDQFFLGGNPSDGFMGSDPVIEIYEPS